MDKLKEHEITELVERLGQRPEVRIAHLEQRLKWAENMIQHYVKCGYLPSLSESEARDFLTGEAQYNPYNPYDRIGKAREILNDPREAYYGESEPYESMIQRALDALEGKWPSR